MKAVLCINAAAFVAGFGFAVAALSQAIEPVRAPQLGAKLAWLAERGAEYDTFFIGSSRVHRQLIPDIFDAEMAALGVKTNSFNLSGDGMRPPEDEFVMERAFATRTARTRLLVVECNSIEHMLDDEDAGTARAVHWHDSARMAVLWRHCWARPIAADMKTSRVAARIWKRVRQLPEHFQHWVWNCGRLGQGSEWVSALVFGEKPGEDARELGSDGYRVPKTGELMSGKTLVSYEKALAAAMKQPPAEDFEDVESQASLARKKAMADRLGARLVLVSSPFLRPAVFAPASREGVVFLDYSAPAKFPELYAPEHRRDPGHLNVKGSEIYTRLVARQIAEALKKQP